MKRNCLKLQMQKTFSYNKKIIINVLCIILCCLIFYADLVISLGYAGGAPYVMVIMTALLLNERAALISYAGLSTILIFLGFLMSHDPDIPGYYFLTVINRFVSVIVVWFITVFCIIYLINRNLARNAEKNIYLIFDSTPSALVLINSEGKIKLANNRLCKLFGYEKKELLGESIELLVPERFRQHHEHYRQGFIKEPVKRAMGEQNELYGLTKKGKEIPIEVRLNPIQLNQAPSVIAAINDITLQRKHLQEIQEAARKLKKSNEELEQFAFIASHDLQEPLRMVSSYTQLLASRYQNRLDNDANEFIDYAVDGAKRMQVMIQDLLKFSRLGSEAVEVEEIDANKLYEDALKNLAIVVEESGTVVTRGELPVIRGEASQLLQVFQNLIGNAVKYRIVEKTNRLHVSAKMIKNEWRFCFQDNGIGIQPQYFEKIFIIFKRLHNKSEYSGTGIGLALCKRIIDNHGGRIWVESEYGQGACFYFTLPLHQ